MNKFGPDIDYFCCLHGRYLFCFFRVASRSSASCVTLLFMRSMFGLVFSLERDCKWTFCILNQDTPLVHARHTDLSAHVPITPFLCRARCLTGAHARALQGLVQGRSYVVTSRQRGEQYEKMPPQRLKSSWGGGGVILIHISIGYVACICDYMIGLDFVLGGNKTLQKHI